MCSIMCTICTMWNEECFSVVEHVSVLLGQGRVSLYTVLYNRWCMSSVTVLCFSVVLQCCVSVLYECCMKYYMGPRGEMCIFISCLRG